jgi:UDP-glucose 4-epimerase
MSRRPAWWLYFLAKIWPITWISAQATQWPIVGGLIARLTVPMFSKKNLNISYIPINANVEGATSSPLPTAIVEELIRRSSHRVLINRCTCRDAKHCKEHPVEYACTLLGEGTREIDPRIARHASVDEAIAHHHKVVADGLIPMTGRVKVDNLIWGVRDEGKLLTVCYCCRCCCTILNSGKYFPPEAAKSLVKLKGLDIIVDRDRCTGCGTCVAECFMDAIKLENLTACHDAQSCKGCGRCATVCPVNAVTVRVSDMDAAVTDLMGRIDGLIDYR